MPLWIIELWEALASHDYPLAFSLYEYHSLITEIRPVIILIVCRLIQKDFICSKYKIGLKTRRIVCYGIRQHSRGSYGNYCRKVATFIYFIPLVYSNN